MMIERGEKYHRVRVSSLTLEPPRLPPPLRSTPPLVAASPAEGRPRAASPARGRPAPPPPAPASARRGASPSSAEPAAGVAGGVVRGGRAVGPEGRLGGVAADAVLAQRGHVRRRRLLFVDRDVILVGIVCARQVSPSNIQA